ncbi:hypothetical protein BKA70DRAFT_1227878 [Coprinopsis sp. MPI-PUGE-AT-0042]|nr:hypothetical protein BKA70DRAFT_1227878 [Coprinopsis sp. MPI-PUGE-AT-0042]
MNRFYNVTDASIVDSITEEVKSCDNEDSPPLLSSVELSEYNVTEFDHPKVFRLTHKGDSDQEAYFRMVGIICSKVLPPLMSKPRVQGTQHVRNLRQFVKLTGLGSLAFDEMQGQLNTVVQLFQDKLGHKSVVSTDEKLYEGDFAIDCHARFYTDRAVAPQEKHIPFHPLVDPRSILEDLRGSNFIHGPDNDVQYLSRKVRDDGVIEYVDADPGGFREGDIVEVTVAIHCIPIKNGLFKFMVGLKGLALLSTKVREASERMRSEELTKGCTSATPPRPLKRRTVLFGSATPRKVARSIPQDSDDGIPGGEMDVDYTA